MRRGVLRYVTLLLVAMLALSACSGAKSEPASTGGKGTGASQPKGPVKLVVGATQDIQHFDIHNHNYTYTEAVHQHVFDYLVYLNPETGKFDPGLAKSWKIVDPKTWEFQLRDDVKFHNGDKFTADDVKFTLERVARDKSLKEQRSNRTIKEVQVVSPTVARIVTFDPDPVLLNRLSRIGSGMLPAKYFQEKGVDGFNKAPIGTGAYKVKEWVKDDHVTLTAVPDHWRGKAKVDEIVFRVIPEVATRVNELVTGGIDIALGINSEDVTSLKKNPDVQVFVEASPRVFIGYLRTSGNYATANPKVREAMDYAIDDKALGDVAMPGLAVPTRTRLVPGVVGAQPDLYNKYLYDVEKAKKLLAEAGYSDTKKPEIGILSRNSANWPDVAQTITGMLEKAGFKVNLEMLDNTAYTKKVDANKNPDMYLTSFGNSMKDGDLAISFALSDENKEWMGYSNPKMDELIKAETTEMDAVKRLQIFADISKILADDRPQLQFFQAKNAYAVRKGIQWKPRADEMLWFHDVTKGN